MENLKRLLLIVSSIGALSALLHQTVYFYNYFKCKDLNGKQITQQQLYKHNSANAKKARAALAMVFYSVALFFVSYFILILI
jgi:hypothetical protein